MKLYYRGIKKPLKQLYDVVLGVNINSKFDYFILKIKRAKELSLDYSAIWYSRILLSIDFK